VTAINPRPRPLPQIGQPRAVRDVKTGWHVQLPSGWHLVLQALSNSFTRDVMLVLRDGPYGERGVPLLPADRLMTRTPQEQIQWVEASRLARGPRGGLGPVSRVHLDEQLMGLVADVVKHEREGEGP